MQRIGNRLKKIRESNSLTQADVAKQAELTRQTISRAEKGNNISFRTIVRLLRVYNRFDALDDFLGEPAVSREDIMDGDEL